MEHIPYSFFGKKYVSTDSHIFLQMYEILDKFNVNPGLVNHGLLIGGYFSNSHVIWYLNGLNGTSLMKQPFGVY